MGARSKATIAVVGVLLAAAWALPAIGASPAKLAKKALKTATQANTTANEALKKAGPGPQGPAGTARAHAYVYTPNCTPAPPTYPANCPFSEEKGITNVTRISIGEYCVTAPGINAAVTPAVATVENLGTDETATGVEAPIVLNNSFSGSCGDDSKFDFITQGLNAATNTVFSDKVSFMVMIP